MEDHIPYRHIGIIEVYTRDDRLRSGLYRLWSSMKTPLDLSDIFHSILNKFVNFYCLC